MNKIEETKERIGISEEDFPKYFTIEVTEMLNISRTTLYRIRRKLLERKLQEENRGVEKPFMDYKKHRYSVNDINEIKQYIKEKNAYHSPLER